MQFAQPGAIVHTPSTIVRRLCCFATGFLVPAVGVAACGGDGAGDAPTEPAPEPSVASVEVAPGSASLDSIGATEQFDATARDQSGAAMSGVEFTWSSSDTAVATVDGSGLATARAEGDATISAAAEGVDGTSSLEVNLPSGRLTRSFATPTEVALKSSIAAGDGRLVLSSGRYLIYSKDGDRLASEHVARVFSDFEDAGGADARAIYDPDSGRFLLVSMDHGVGGRHSTDTPGRYFLAVSSSSTPSGFGASEWHTYAFETVSGPDEPAIFPDIPRVAVTDDAVVLVGQVIAVDPDRRTEFGCFTQIVTLEKSTVVSGGSPEPTFVDQILDGERSCAWLQPVRTAPGSQLPMVSEGPDCVLRVWTLTSPLADPSVESLDVPGTTRTDPYFCDGLPRAPQPGTDVMLRTGRRSQPMMQPTLRNGSIWTATTIGVRTESGDVTGVRWAEVDAAGLPGSAPLGQSGTFHTEHYAFYPAIAANADGDFVVAYGRSSTTLSPGAYYRFADAGFPGDSISAPQLLRGGETSMTSGPTVDGAIRFGEFFDVTPDPVDDGLWMVGQYAKASDRFDLWTGKIAF